MRLTALVSALLLAACGGARAAHKPPATASSVLIVTIDTLRADRVGIYGSTVATPNIDRLAREGAWVEQVDVPAPLTRPSHVSLFTGLYPDEHGIRDNISAPLAASVPLLQEQFKRHGYATGAFVASSVLDHRSGLARGFDVYDDRFALGADRKRGDFVATEAIDWLRGHPSNFFAWVHLYDVHAPYQPPEPYASHYAGRPYDGSVAWCDDLVGRLVAALDGIAALDGTLIVVTSDHGEALGDHGEDVHGYFVYEATLRVPLVIRGPGVKAGTHVHAVSRTIDLFPTVAGLMQLGGDVPATSGRTLEPAFRGEPLSDTPAFAESLVPSLHYGWSELHAVRDGRWKFILAPRPELYDLQQDPGELHNLSAAQPSRANVFRATLESRVRQQAARGETARSAVPADVRERLGALGYVGPGGTPVSPKPARPKAEKADPKDMLQDYKALSQSMQDGLIALGAGRAADAIERFRAVASRGIDSYESHYYLARAYAGASRWSEAAAEYDHALARLPSDADALRGLGDSRVALHDAPGAIRAYERLVAAAPGDAVALMQLGEAYRDAARYADAARAIRQALKIDPDPAQYWNSLGTVLGASLQMGDAERAFAEASARDPNNGMYAYNRGLALQQ
ncbi:MAG TPA: sulfatase-like hydrolase/transferase, partial [Vicinamibacterales bacterium]